MSDRDSSLLAESHREFLQTPGASNDVEYTRQRRAEIRKRVREGIRDMEILVEAAAQDRIDLSTVMSPGLDKTEAQKSESDVEAPSAWPLVALLFAWTEGHKITPTSLFSDGQKHGPTDEIKQRTQMVDLQVQEGIRRAFEIDPPDRVVNEVENELEISLGPELSGLDDMDLAAFPKHILDQLHRAGEISSKEYANIYSERVERVEAGELDPKDPRPPIGRVNPVDMENFEDLETYLIAALGELENNTSHTSRKESDDGETGRGG